MFPGGRLGWKGGYYGLCEFQIFLRVGGLRKLPLRRKIAFPPPRWFPRFALAEHCSRKLCTFVCFKKGYGNTQQIYQVQKPPTLRIQIEDKSYG